MTDTAAMNEIELLTAEIRAFADLRDWARFHDPKSLFIALTGEVGEAAEVLQWLDAGEAKEALAEPGLHERWSSELADIAIYLMRLADVTDVDLTTAIRDKLLRNAERYTVEASRGNATKR